MIILRACPKYSIANLEVFKWNGLNFVLCCYVGNAASGT